MAETVTSEADSQEFDRVHWAKCQARAERYEEEVQLTIEEMGRTLQYFEWKRDWWLSLFPQLNNSNNSPDVQDGLRAYASRQSSLYDQLITLFVSHWRKYLSAHSLGSSWLGGYASRPDLARVRPLRRQKVDAGSVRTAVIVPVTPTLSTDPETHVDAPLDSGSDNDSDDIAADAEGDMDVYLDADDMFADE
jgi:hypothetical protein